VSVRSVSPRVGVFIELPSVLCLSFKTPFLFPFVGDSAAGLPSLIRPSVRTNKPVSPETILLVGSTLDVVILVSTDSVYSVSLPLSIVSALSPRGLSACIPWCECDDAFTQGQFISFSWSIPLKVALN